MNETNERKESKKQSHCRRCGNEYPKYQLVRDGKKVDKGYYPDCDCIVDIKLKKWQIPILLGAISLGIYTENLCSQFLDASTKGEDNLDKSYPREDDSFKWSKHSKVIMDMIGEQTEINLEYKVSADNGDVLKALGEFARDGIYQRICRFRDEGLNRQWLERDYLSEEEGIEFGKIV